MIISASRNIASSTQQEVIDQVVRELAEVFPQAGQAVLLHARLVTEHRAVFSARPGAERLRPAQQTPIANVQLAGDWTRTGWPSTMEGAVRSGYLAAENVLRHLGRPEAASCNSTCPSVRSRAFCSVSENPRTQLPRNCQGPCRSTMSPSPLDTFRTDRLIAERLRPQHRADYVRMFGDARVMATLSPDGKPLPAEESVRWLQHSLDHWDRHGYGYWAIRDPSREPVCRPGRP